MPIDLGEKFSISLGDTFAQIKAASHPINVHPKIKFIKTIAPRLRHFLLSAKNDGKKYNTKPITNTINPKATLLFEYIVSSLLVGCCEVYKFIICYFNINQTVVFPSLSLANNLLFLLWRSLRTFSKTKLTSAVSDNSMPYFASN